MWSTAQILIMYASLFISLFFEVFLVITYLERRDELKDEEAKPNSLNFPTTTIIVPCFNEEKTILKTIDSLLSLDYPKNKLNIYIIDDGSTDNSQEVLKTLIGNPQITIDKKENGGKHTALNHVLEKIDSDLVGCLDADSFVDSLALKRIVTHFDDPEVMAVTPAVKVFEPKTVLQLIQHVEYGWGIFLRKMLSYLGALYVTPGPFSIFRTKVFRELGGYRAAHHTEDLEMALRMQTNHYKIVNAHDASVYTVTPETLSTLYKQRVRWTYGFLNNVIDYKFLFFKKEYGNIGLYILPMATISIFTGLYFMANFIISTVMTLVENIIKFNTVGLTLNLENIFTFDWFFFNTDSPVFITAIIFMLSITILILSRIMSDKKFHFSIDLIYFITIYAFIVPLWLSKAVWNTLFAKEITWR